MGEFVPKSPTGQGRHGNWNEPLNPLSYADIAASAMPEAWVPVPVQGSGRPLTAR